MGLALVAATAVFGMLVLGGSIKDEYTQVGSAASGLAAVFDGLFPDADDGAGGGGTAGGGSPASAGGMSGTGGDDGQIGDSGGSGGRRRARHRR